MRTRACFCMNAIIRWTTSTCWRISPRIHRQPSVSVSVSGSVGVSVSVSLKEGHVGRGREGQKPRRMSIQKQADVLRYVVPKPVGLIETMQRSLLVYSFDEIGNRLVQKIRSHDEPPHYVHLTPRKDKSHNDVFDTCLPKKKVHP